MTTPGYREGEVYVRCGHVTDDDHIVLVDHNRLAESKCLDERRQIAYAFDISLRLLAEMARTFPLLS